MDDLSYSGWYRLTGGIVMVFLGCIGLFGAPAVLVFFPETYQAVFGGPGRLDFLFNGPRLLVVGFWGGLTAFVLWRFLWTAKAAAAEAPLVKMDGKGVTCFSLRGRSKSFAWAEITSISHRSKRLTFYGASSWWSKKLGDFSTFGQDLRAIQRVIARYRPDLVQSLG